LEAKMPRSAVALLVLLLVAAPLTAQQTPVVDRPVQAKTMPEGVLAGSAAAQTIGTGGSFAGGMAGGLFLGLIGTGIAYVAQGPSQPTMTTVASNQQYGADYMMGFNQAFADESKRRKKSSALTGGLIGTGVLVLLVVSAGGS
jgi:hypothetical protein